MQKLIFFLSFLIILSNNLYGETEDPGEFFKDAEYKTTENKQQIPQALVEIVKRPSLVESEFKFPKKKSVLEAAGKSAVFPGFGHYYLEKNNRALVIAGVEIALLAGVVYSDPGQYSGSSQDEIYQQRETLKVLVGLVWVWNIFDAISIAVENNHYVDAEEKRFKQYTEGSGLNNNIKERL
jgi:hypothetical protein